LNTFAPLPGPFVKIPITGTGFLNSLKGEMAGDWIATNCDAVFIGWNLTEVYGMILKRRSSSGT